MSLLVQELFDYSAQGLNGLNGGTGWTGAWTATSSGSANIPQVVANNLSFTGVSNGTVTYDNKMFMDIEGNNSTGMGWNRSFDAVPNTVNGAVYWFAFVVASYQAKGTVNLIFFNKLTTDAAGNNPAPIWNLSGSSLSEATIVSNGTTLYEGDSGRTPHVLVYKITMSGAAGTPVRTDIYVDVNMTTDPTGWSPTTTSTAWYVPASITNIAMTTNSAATSGGDTPFYMDNLRWATTSYEAGGNAAPSVATGSWWFLFN